MCEQAANPDPIEKTCPECGADHGTQTLDPAHWHNRWRLIPTFIWLVLVLLFITYTTPWYQGILGNPIATATHHSSAVNNHLYVLNPPLRASMVTDYPDSARDILRQGFEQLEMESSDWWEDSNYRFLFHRGSGYAFDTSLTGLGSPWWGVRAETRFRSVNVNRIVNGAYDYDVDKVMSGQFGFLQEIESPPLIRKTARLHGAQLETRFLSIVSIVETLLVVGFICHGACLLVAKFTGRTNKRLRWGLVVLALFFLVVIGSRHTEQTHSVSSHLPPTKPEDQMTPWYSDQEFIGIRTSDDDREDLLKAIKPLTYSASPNWVLAFQPRHNHSTDIEKFTGAFSEFHPVWVYKHFKFMKELEDGTSVPAERCARVPAGFDIQVDSMISSVTLIYARDSDMFSIRVFWARFLSLVIISWFLLRLLRKSSLGILHMRQRGRAQRNLCAVCAYPKPSTTST